MWECRKGSRSGYGGEVWDVIDPHGSWVACFALESEAKEYANYRW